MKRSITAALIAIVVVILASLILPVGLADRGKDLRKAGGKRAIPRPVTTASSAALPPKTPGGAISGKAVGFAKTIPVRDMTGALQKNFVDKLKNRVPIDSYEGNNGEVNKANREIIRRVDAKAPGTPDGALARVPAGKQNGTLAPQVMPGPTVSFEAISLTDTTALPGQGFLPPDTVGEIGPNHFVQMVNSAYRIYDRAGVPQIALTSIGALFSALPGPCAGSEDGDPIVVYDQLADRWLLSEFCTVANPNTHQLIAISQTGDPTGAYYVYDFVMPNNKFNDYPKFGVWSDAYVMTDNQFNQAGTQFLGAGVFAFDRAKMIAGDPTATFNYFDKAEGCPAACQFGGMLPADIDGFVPPAAGAPAPFIQFDADEFGATDSLRIFDFHADFAVPGNATFTERTGSPLAVAAFDPREVPAGSRNVIPQPPAGVSVDAISDRLMFRLAYRNFGTHESLAMNHTVNAAVNPAFRAAVRYYEIRKTTPAGAWTVQEQATMAGGAGDTEHRWMGSAALNGAGSLAVGYSVSSATVFPSIRYAGRLVGDPAGSLAQGEATLVAGTSSQTHSSGRWGDYSDMTVDPIDDCTFWYTQEYVTGTPPTDSTRWHTRVGSFLFGPCAPVQKGVLTGTITSAAGGAAIPNATVTAGPFVRSSNGSGVYNIDPMGTGTYTETASATGYFTGVVPGVVVTLGNTTTQNIALVPQNILEDGTPTITAESCSPANNALDPGETVTINLPIVNNGGSGATTSNLVATLQAVGGVSSPSGPQNYGVVAQGSPAVVRPFTFTVSATCGNFVDITLQLQDGATDYGTIVYSLRTGTLGAPSSANHSTGNIATAIPDVNTVDIPINVASTGAVADINVRVRLNHTFDADLTLSLVAPDGTIVTLAANRDTAAGGGDNYGTGANDCSGTPTIFDDAAATPIGSGLPPFAGTFQPDSPLSAMNGRSVAGTWLLRVNDNAAIDVGTVGCVTLEITRQPFICCGVVGTPVIAASTPNAISLENCGLPTPNGAIDPGETVTVSFPVINTGDGNTTNLVGTLQTTGGVSEVYNNTQNYGVVVASGPAITRSFRFRASPGATCGGTLTATIALQDGAINLGTVTYTFTLGTSSVATVTFSNATPIVIPASGTGVTTGAPATPYPAPIAVAGITAPVSKVTVTLRQMSHTFPNDVDVLLVGPTGVKFIVMSDVIGGTDWTGQTYTFDDGAASGLPSSGAPPASGSFKPTNIGTGDLFPAPAPAAPYLTPATGGTDTLAAFNGLNPNGTWNLYVVDDAGTDIGTFAGGWDLAITTTEFNCCGPTASTASITGSVRTPDGSPLAGTVINLSGSQSRRTITDASGNYRFADVETNGFYSVTPAMVNHRFTPEVRSFSQVGNNTDAAFTATPDSASGVNRIDTPEYFVRQHYLDFLGREPDESGFNFWSDQILGCGADAGCIERRTINVSAAYFLSIEFQQTGGLVDGLYRASYNRRPLYAEFMPDTGVVARDVLVGRSGWEVLLDANKQAFVEAWVQRPAFQSVYGGLTSEAYVDTLIGHTGVVFDQNERNDLVNGLGAGTLSRAFVLRRIVENERFVNAKRNDTFVMMQYFGYLRRDADADGFQFWLNKLNQFGGNFEQAQMVKAFITSGEYRQRFR